MWGKYSTACPAMAFLDQISRHQGATNTVTLILFDESYEAHASNMWMIPAFPYFIEWIDIVIFATHEEGQSVGNFFTRTRNPAECAAKVLHRQTTAFSRLKFYILAQPWARCWKIGIFYSQPLLSPRANLDPDYQRINFSPMAYANRSCSAVAKMD